MSISSLGIGSGLDLNGLLDQLRDAEREKLEPIQQRLESEETRISAYGKLEGVLSEFQAASDALSDTALYKSLSTDISGEAVTAAADETAMPGSYSVNVTSLATRGTLASQGITEAADAAISGSTEQTMTFTFGNGDTSEVTVAASSSLEDIRDAINADPDAGVNASVINDGENYRLALSSRETGADASIEGFTLSGLTEDSSAAQSGTDASLTVNGVSISSANNQVEGAIQGVTLNLESEDEATVVVEQDTLAVREAVTGFVDAYNTMKESVGELTAFNPETGQAGELNGDSTVRIVESRLRSELSGGVAGGDDGFSILSDIGISLELDGTMSIDQEKLDNVIANDQQALSDFFAGNDATTGLAEQLSGSVEQLLSSNGSVQGAINGAEGRMESLGDRYTSMEKQVERTIGRYRTQFGQLDSMIAQMNQTSSYLTQQFASLDAQLGRD